MSENWTPKWSALSQAEMSGCPQFKTEVSENLDIRMFELIYYERYAEPRGQWILPLRRNGQRHGITNLRALTNGLPRCSNI